MLQWFGKSRRRFRIVIDAVREGLARQEAMAAELAELKQLIGRIPPPPPLPPHPAAPVDTRALEAEVARIGQLVQRFSSESRDKLAREVVEAVGHRGDGQTSLYRAFIGSEEPIVSPPATIPFTSSLCHQVHFSYDQYRFWVRAMKDRPTFVRKQWEWVYITQALYERGYLTAGKRGIAYGAGLEPLPALFASFGAAVVATDQNAESAAANGWAQSHQHTYDLSALNDRGICTDFMFRKLVSFKTVDMNAIPAELDGTFDFCWSSCALEHLGSLQHGLDFIENSLKTLRPGGIAVHTTEFNISSNTHTMETPFCSIYRRCDIDGFLTKMTAMGYEVSPINWSLGEGFAETVVDLPPFNQRGEPHIRIKIDDYDATSIGLIIRKPDIPSANRPA